MSSRIYTFAEAGRTLNVNRQVVSALVKAHGITPQAVPTNGSAKGLTERDMRVIRKALGLPSRGPKTAPAVQP